MTYLHDARSKAAQRGLGLWLICLCLGGSAAADGCPTAPDFSAEMAPLYDQLLVVPNAAEAQIINNTMWRFWSTAPDAPSQAMLDEGMAARASYDFLRALDRFDALVGYCPFYAEGYNQRAFVNFMRGAYDAALPDLEQALALNPRHVGALSGYALTLLALGLEEQGQAALRAAVEINPWLSERHLLKDAPGQEL